MRSAIFNQISASLSGVDTLKLFGSVDKQSALLQKSQLKTTKWSVYTNAQDFIQEVNSYTWPFSSQDWEKFMAGLAEYSCNKYSTKCLLRTAIHENASVSLVNYKQVCGGIPCESAIAYIRIVGKIMILYPRSRVIRSIALGLLARMYKNAKVLTQADTELYAPHVALAFEMLSQKTRDEGSVQGAIGIIVSIYKTRRHVVRAYVTQMKCDTMLIVFGIQDEFSENDGVMRMCNKISNIFLPVWHAVASSANTTTRLPIDIIVDSMRQNSGSRVHLQLGSQQLHDLSQMNFNTVKISHRNMVFVSKMINDINMKLPRPTESERVYNLWTFLHLCVCTPESFDSFQLVFGVDYLMRSLMSFVTDQDNMLGSNADCITRCLSQICFFIQRSVNGPNPDIKHQFLEADGISTFMATITNQCHSSNTQYDAPLCLTCISIMLHIFVTCPEMMIKYLLMSTRHGQLVPVRFSYGVDFKNAGQNKTLHDFLWTGLGHMLNKDIHIATDVQNMRTMEHTVVFLFEISKYWDLIRDDITTSMANILSCAKRCTLVFGNRIPTVQTIHINAHACLAFMQQMVYTMDSMIENYTHGMVLHNMPLSVHSKVAEEYMALTKPYREVGTKLFAFTFSPVHVEST
jgi:hypothetical protein